MNLIDTDVLIDYLHKIEIAEKFLESIRANEDDLIISIITRMELIQGCRNKREMFVILDILEEFQLIHITEQISWKAEELMENYTMSHGLLIPDAIIAATAINMDLVLYSRNVRHFSIIDGLKLLKPY
ncbi:MAG: hypothetical protein QG641_1278 [Candidatus Poribacteria bacterium]|nr:hypothetical protein [Candidatus Poribacteria bacterium]